MPKLKQQLSKISPLTIGLVVVFAAIMSAVVLRSFAASGTATMYASPGGTQSVGLNGSFTVNVRITSGANVPTSGAVVYMTYPTDKVQVQGVNYSGSSYSLQLVESNSAGTLRMDRGAFPVATGDKLFAAVTFKAIKSGSAGIGFSGSSVVTSGEDDTNILAGRNGVTYNISAPAAPAPGTPAQPSAPGSSPSVSASNQARSSSGGGSNAAGSRSSNGSSSGAPASSSAPQTGQADPSAPVDASNPAAMAQQPEISGETHDIQIIVLDKQKKPVKGAEVTYMDQTVVTDENGIARFSKVPVGVAKVSVNYKGNKIDKQVAVKGASTSAAPLSYNLEIERNKFNPVVVLVPPIAGILVVAGVIFGRPWLMRRIKGTPYTGNSAAVVSDAPAFPHLYAEAPKPGSSFAPQQQPGANDPNKQEEIK